MTSLNKADLTKATTKAIEWPAQLRTPSELMQGLRLRTSLCLLRSPLCTKIILQVVGAWAYLVAHVFNRTRVFNIETFNQELRHIEEKQQERQRPSLDPLERPANSNYDGLLRSQLSNAKKNEELVPKNTISRRPIPLITLSNHISCIDDPVLWGSLLPLTHYSTNTESVRWSAAAVEICFSKPWHSTFFSLGKTFPIVRGVGLNQPAMDFAAALLKYNQWLHMFPEGRVMRDANQQEISNKERGYIFKWGISKLILDYFKAPAEHTDTDGNNNNDDSVGNNEELTCEKKLRILPFYHLGLDEILPIGWPHIPRFGKRITILIRPSVIELNVKKLAHILATQTLSGDLIKSKTDDDIKKIKLTNYLEQEVEKLIEPATRLHRNKTLI